MTFHVGSFYNGLYAVIRRRNAPSSGLPEVKAMSCPGVALELKSRITPNAELRNNSVPLGSTCPLACKGLSLPAAIATSENFPLPAERHPMHVPLRGAKGDVLAGCRSTGIADVIGRIVGPEVFALPNHAVHGGGQEEFQPRFHGRGVGGLPVEMPGHICLGVGADVQRVMELAFEFVGTCQADIGRDGNLRDRAVHLCGDDRIAQFWRLLAADGTAPRPRPPPPLELPNMPSPRFRIGPPITTS